jgi:hypothetical protein
MPSPHALRQTLPNQPADMPAVQQAFADLAHARLHCHRTRPNAAILADAARGAA